MNGTNSRKALVSLATLLAAGAVAVGSGATFTSTTATASSAVTSGTLLHSNSRDGLEVLGLTNMKPGDVVNGTVVLENTGSLAGTFTLRESSSTNTFGVRDDGSSYLRLTIRDGATTLYDGDFGGLADSARLDLGQLAPAEQHTLAFRVTLDSTAPNSQQGRTGSASYEFVETQIDGQTYNQ